MSRQKVSWKVDADPLFKNAIISHFKLMVDHMSSHIGPGFALSDKYCSSSQLYKAAAAINCNYVEHIAAQELKCFF